MVHGLGSELSASPGRNPHSASRQKLGTLPATRLELCFLDDLQGMGLAPHQRGQGHWPLATFSVTALIPCCLNFSEVHIRPSSSPDPSHNHLPLTLVKCSQVPWTMIVPWFQIFRVAQFQTIGPFPRWLSHSDISLVTKCLPSPMLACHTGVFTVIPNSSLGLRHARSVDLSWS
jgi:hypothetical protein